MAKRIDEKVHLRFLRMATVLALETCKASKHKVGAILVSPDTRRWSGGYAGFPAGVDEGQKRWGKPEKYDWVIHAETNAIINCPFDTAGCILYCTHQPCHKCMGQIVNAGITSVVYEAVYDSDHLQRLDVWKEIASMLETVMHVPDPFCEKLRQLYIDEGEVEYGNIL